MYNGIHIFGMCRWSCVVSWRRTNDKSKCFNITFMQTITYFLFPYNGQSISCLYTALPSTSASLYQHRKTVSQNLVQCACSDRSFPLLHVWEGYRYVHIVNSSEKSGGNLSVDN